MKKLLTLLLTATLIITLTSCSLNPFSKKKSVEESETSESTSESSKNDSGSGMTSGTNQDDAEIIPLNTKINGTLRDGNPSWYAFTTDSDSDVEYVITTVNKSTKRDINIELCDEYGRRIYSTSASVNGKAATIEADRLYPNTTYYVSMYAGDDICNYTLKIQMIED